MKRSGKYWVLVGLAGVILHGAGCRMVVTAPARAERREKAAEAFDRLAALTPEQIAGFLDHRLFAKLGLTDGQRPQVSALNLKHASRLRAIAGSGESVRAKVRAMKAENDIHEADLKEVLTADQFTRFLAQKDEMRAALQELRSEK